MNIDLKVDCSGLSCPMPIVKASQGIKKLQSGQIMEMISTDPSFELDIQAWTKKTGHTLKEYKQASEKYIAYIMKT